MATAERVHFTLKISLKFRDTVDLHVVQHYTSDLRNLLVKSPITEQRGFLKSFVEKIEADDEKVKIYYTVPIPPSSQPEETSGISPFVHHG